MERGDCVSDVSMIAKASFVSDDAVTALKEAALRGKLLGEE